MIYLVEGDLYLYHILWENVVDRIGLIRYKITEFECVCWL